MAAAFLGDDAPTPLRARHDLHWDAVVSLSRSGLSSPLTSSAGRLFDAVAALVGVRDTVNYEGQAAIELEQRADPAEAGAYPMAVADGPPLRLAGHDLVRAAAEDLAAGVPVPPIAARFHNGLTAAVVDVCVRLGEVHGLTTVALSGGVFQNLLLLGRVVDGLEARGLRVLVHSRVPPNDGGISLGQAAVAGARDRSPTATAGWRR
jgi:hydrogenase maturation protein HypF